MAPVTQRDAKSGLSKHPPVLAFRQHPNGVPEKNQDEDRQHGPEIEWHPLPKLPVGSPESGCEFAFINHGTPLQHSGRGATQDGGASIR